MSESRRDFLKGSVAVGAGLATPVLGIGDDLDDDVRREMQRRLTYLTPPDGTPPDLENRPSPPHVPFTTELFVPPTALPILDLRATYQHFPLKLADIEQRHLEECLHSEVKANQPIDFKKFETQKPRLIEDERERQLPESDQVWLTIFRWCFKQTAEYLSTRGIEIGDPPDPWAHQRFFEFKPQLIYIYWEREFEWQYQAELTPQEILDEIKRRAEWFREEQVAAYKDEFQKNPDVEAEAKIKLAVAAYSKSLSDAQTSWGRGTEKRPGSLTWGFETICDFSHVPNGESNLPASLSNEVVLGGRRFAGSPGPTFKARYGEPVLVRRVNNLPEILNDETVNPQRRGIKFALPSTTTHLHNAHTASESDGNPNDWINPSEYWDHHYANFPSGHDEREKLSTLWYHDHRMDFTASNVYAGLDGFYFLFDEFAFEDQSGTIEVNSLGKDAGGLDVALEAAANFAGRQLSTIEKQRVKEAFGKTWRLPSGKYDIPLILHDLLFATDSKNGMPQLVFDGFNTDGILGDCLTVNRTIQPRIKVEPRKYRFRLLDGGPSRFYELFLQRKQKKTPPVEALASPAPINRCEDEPSEPFVVICGDGNFQPNPMIARSVFLGVAQRVDVIVDFSQYEVGEEIFLVNQLEQTNGRGPSGKVICRKGYPGCDEKFFADNALVCFEVGPPEQPDESAFPLKFRDLPPVDLTEVRRERLWEFDFDGGLWTINGHIYDPNRIDAGIEQDTAEIWTFRNVGNSWSHPIHSHFTEFIVLEINGVPQYQNVVQQSKVPIRQSSHIREFLPDVSNRLTNEQLEQKGKTDPQMQRKIDDVKQAIQGSHKEIKQYGLFLWLLKAELNSTKYKKLGEFAIPVIDSVRTPDEFFEEVRFPTYELFDLTVKFLADKLFWGQFLGKGNVLANLSLLETENEVIGKGRFMGGPRRDVAILLPDWEVTVFMRWKDFLGKHVMHCHNVVHEDHAMMIRWDIVPPGHGFDTPKRSREFYGQVDPHKPHVQPAPGHSQAHENDSDTGRR